MSAPATPPTGPKRTVEICHDLDAYAALLPNPFGRELFAATNATSLDAPMLDLVHAWRSASDSHALPGLLARSVPEGLHAFLKTDRTRDLLRRALMALAERAGIVSNLPLNGMQRRALRREVDRIVPAIEREWPAAEAREVQISIEEAWQMYLTEQAFKSAIVGLEFFAFTTLYFAYETYIAQVLRVVTKHEPPTNANGFRESIVAAFDVAAARDHWDAAPVRAARIVRNAHVHRADRLRANEIQDVEVLVPCAGDVPLVTAIQTRRLVDELRPRVLTFTAITLAKLGETPRPESDTPTDEDACAT
ncbi:MAG: hypothetical protein K8T90_12080 [Planctomycetes bacterium]|nr:hypothetical protein [Planctomycetota bacterium]